MHLRHGNRRQQWTLLVAPACALVLCLGTNACKKTQPRAESRASPQPAGRAPMIAENCDDARHFPESVSTNDVRFIDCGEAVLGTGEAFELGEPVHVPVSSATPTAAGKYTPGHCDHHGGAIMDYDVFYAAEDYAVAIECSRQRCDAKDARGCNDLGALYWYDVLPAVHKDEPKAIEAFEAGCKLGFGRSCLWLATIFEERHDSARAQLHYRAACHATPPSIEACSQLGEMLTAQGHAADAKPYLLRACRGTTPSASAFGAQRQGCGLLAEAAAQRGDSVSQREYLRLECAYGTAAPAACAQLGQLLFASGDTRRAAAYLRRACESVTQAKAVFAEACQTLTRIERGRQSRWRP